MVLKAGDELRHTSILNEDYYWRESLYFNFNDSTNRIGGWLYLWVVPNQPEPSGMLVSLYHGQWPDFTINDKAMSSDGHRIVEGDRWIYCFKRDVDYLIDEDFDDVSLCGMTFRRVEPLRRQHLKFEDPEGNGFDLEAEFLMPPYDYADGAHKTPYWMATNRYHRSWHAKGVLTIAGHRYQVDCTGDSDHSWGQRHNIEFAKNLFKMWSFQSREHGLSVSVLKQGVSEEDEQIPLGYVTRDGRVAAATRIETSASYDQDGVQSSIVLEVEDELGRVVKAQMSSMHAFVGSGSLETLWGYEGVGDYIVDGIGKVQGLCSYFWPARVTPARLSSGEWA
jgi:hypothetical protein